MRSLGAIVVGIGSYRLDRTKFPPLRYATDDADAIIRYLFTCWPKPKDNKIILINEDHATATHVTEAFRSLENDGPYDLQLIFLSGHGLIEAGNAGFVLQPPSGEGKYGLLGHSELEQLLVSVRATQTILILDCCHAEGIVRRMKFFSRLDNSDARLFIASSREHQRTWEDDTARHGIFTAHLLDLLNSGSSVKLDGVRDHLDVDGELFPVLCDQVPLYVFAHKQQRQEPVKGGISIRTVSLPVAQSARRIKERSAFGTAMRRMRQILLSVGVVGLVFLILTYSFVYYAEVDRSGAVYLRHGTKWLAPIFEYLPTILLDTGINATDLSRDPVRRYSVQAGWTTGIWMHVSKRGYRAWYNNLRPSLEPIFASHYDVLIAAGEQRPVFLLNDESKPSEIAFAAWALLDKSDSKQLDALLSRVLGSNRAVPLVSKFNPRELDFEILDRSQQDIANYADALRYTAAIDPQRVFTTYIGFLKACSIWLEHSSLERHGREAQRRVAEDVADVLETIAKVRKDQGKSTQLDKNMLSVLNSLEASGYEDLVRLALSRVSDNPSQMKTSAQVALSTFQGNMLEPAEALAIRQLKDLLDASVASQTIVETVYQRFVTAGEPESVYLTGFLIAAADKRAIPPSVMAILLTKAQEAITQKDDSYMAGEYARILAHAMSQVPMESRDLVYKLIEQVTTQRSPMSTTLAEIYTALGRQRLETEDMLQHILLQAKSAPPYQSHRAETVEEPLPGLAIIVGHGPWLEALAVLGTLRHLSPEAIEVLEARTNDPALRDTIIRALSNQSKWAAQMCWKSSCSRMLKSSAQDSIKRQLATSIMAENISKLTHVDFLAALKALDEERAAEIEPEIRIALGSARITSQLARVRTIPIGSRLFE